MDINLAWRVAAEHKIQQKRTEWEWLLVKCEQYDVQTVLEIGCYSGGGTFSFGTFAERLISIDHIDPPMFDISQIGCRYDYVAGNSAHPSTVEKVGALLGTDKVDLLFIDGNHSYDGVKRDFELYAKFASKLVAFHDIVDSKDHRNAGCFVSRFWSEIKARHKNTEEAIKEDGNWGGIGVIIV
jgi:hypothetical protein